MADGPPTATAGGRATGPEVVTRGYGGTTWPPLLVALKLCDQDPDERQRFLLWASVPLWDATECEVRAAFTRWDAAGRPSAPP